MKILGGLRATSVVSALRQAVHGDVWWWGQGMPGWNGRQNAIESVIRPALAWSIASANERTIRSKVLDYSPELRMAKTFDALPNPFRPLIAILNMGFWFEINDFFCSLYVPTIGPDEG